MCVCVHVCKYVFVCMQVREQAGCLIFKRESPLEYAENCSDRQARIRIEAFFMVFC